MIMQNLDDYNALSAELSKFAELKDGWNGKQTKGVTKETICHCDKLLLRILNAIPYKLYTRLKYLEVFPTNKGGAQFELGTDTREVEIEFSPTEPALAVLLVDRSTGIYVFREENCPPLSIKKIMTWLKNNNPDPAINGTRKPITIQQARQNALKLMHDLEIDRTRVFEIKAQTTITSE